MMHARNASRTSAAATVQLVAMVRWFDIAPSRHLNKSNSQRTTIDSQLSSGAQQPLLDRLQTRFEYHGANVERLEELDEGARCFGRFRA